MKKHTMAAVVVAALAGALADVAAAQVDCRLVGNGYPIMQRGDTGNARDAGVASAVCTSATTPSFELHAAAGVQYLHHGELVKQRGRWIRLPDTWEWVPGQSTTTTVASTGGAAVLGPSAFVVEYGDDRYLGTEHRIYQVVDVIVGGQEQQRFTGWGPTWYMSA